MLIESNGIGASWAHRTGENEEKKDNDKIKNRSKRRAPVVGAIPVDITVRILKNTQLFDL